MDDDLFSLEIISEGVDYIFYTDAYYEFCNQIAWLDKIGSDNDLYLEAVNDKHDIKKRNGGKIVKNTIDTTASVGKVYGNVVSAGGTVMKGAWDVVVKTIEIITSATKFIADGLTVLPNTVLKMLNKVEGIPENIKAKIHGNITLYITMDDIELLYNRSLLYRLDNFIGTLKLLTQGDMWNTVFKRETHRDENGIKIKDNDMKLCRKLDEIYNQISNIEFKPTVIDMSDQNNVNTYLGSRKCITFTDLNGVNHTDTYYDAIKQLIDDISKRKNVVETLQSAFGDKYSRAQNNQTFAKLSTLAQDRVTTAMKEISKVVSIVGHIMKCVSSDMKTISGAIGSITKKQDKLAKKEAKTNQSTEELAENPA